MSPAINFRIKEPWVAVTLLGMFVLLVLFVLFPVIQVIRLSPIETYFNLLADARLRRPLINSLVLGVSVAWASTVIGYFLAYTVERTGIAGRRTLHGVASLPLIAPPFIIAISAIILLGRNGILTRLLFSGTGFPLYGFWGLLLVQTLHLFPLAYLVCRAALIGIDPSVEEASINCGATSWTTFRRVTFPLTLPAVASSVLLGFIESLADFGTPLILSGNYPVLSVESYLKIVGAERDLAGGSALAVLLLVPTLIAFVVQRFFIEKRSYTTVLGKTSSARLKRASPPARFVFGGIAFFLTALILLFYGTVLYGSLTQVWGAQYGITFRHYLSTFREGWGFIRTTILLSAIGTPFSGLLGIGLATLLVRKRFFGKGFVEFLSMLTFAVPGTVVGIGYILAFNEPPLALQGTALIIILLFIFRNMPVGLRAGIAALKQIDRSIEEAAHSLGANNLKVFTSITVPLLKPALFSGLAFSFIKSMVAISAVIFVVSGRWNLITLAILGYVETGELSQAAALCVFLVAVVGIVLWGLQWVTRGRKREFVEVAG